MPRCAAYLSGPRPCACCPLKSSSVVSCRHSTTDCIAILCVVCCQCGSRMARQSTFALSKKRYAAIVSLHPLHALGTLAVGVAAILSISVLARRFRRASPRSSCPNSVAVHAVDLLAICAVQKTRVNLKRPQFTRGAGKSLNVKDFFRASDAGYRLVYNEVRSTAKKRNVEEISVRANITGSSSQKIRSLWIALLGRMTDSTRNAALRVSPCNK